MERASPLGVPVAHLAIGNGPDLCPAVATHRAVCRSPTRAEWVGDSPYSPAVLVTHRSDFDGTRPYGLIEHGVGSSTISSVLLVVPPIARGLKRRMSALASVTQNSADPTTN